MWSYLTVNVLKALSWWLLVFILGIGYSSVQDMYIRRIHLKFVCFFLILFFVFTRKFFSSFPLLSGLNLSVNTPISTVSFHLWSIFFIIDSHILKSTVLLDILTQMFSNPRNHDFFFTWNQSGFCSRAVHYSSIFNI